MTTTQQCSALADRIFADLLDVRDSSEIGDAVSRRVQHLPARDALVVIGQVVGMCGLLIEQVRDHSTSGRDILTEVRDGFVTQLVANQIKNGE